MEFGFSLGSNQGDAIANMREAKRQMLAAPDVQWVAQSPLYETEPVGVAPEYAELKFINAVLVLEAPCSPSEWLTRLRELEQEMGRIRTGDRNAPRPIDVDILYADDQIIDRGDLIVPHPRWAERRFVVQPLADVRPDLILPGAGKTVRDILASLKGEAVTRLDTEW